MAEGVKLSWNQAVCDACWELHYRGGPAVRVKERDVEQCCWCGQRTESGIYVRDDPMQVRYPRVDKGDDALPKTQEPISWYTQRYTKP